MTYLVLKFLHVGSMFLATAFAVGPIVVFVLILRTGDIAAIRRAFRFAEPVSRLGGVSYGLGVLFGIVTAINGGIALTTPWLLTGYGFLALLIATNLYADRWMRRVHLAAESAAEGPSAELDAWRQAAGPVWSLAAAIVMTLAIVFVMVVKPNLF
jgi:hypothetical protein